ncbi:ATP-grasp domain-containing protein [Actinoplanes regularis]|uniref:ATP-grasp domain-containing protein n=1 Tax=Actinoplanes regularis TaxID=52697 RepID=A0A238Z4H1_9ACTN|nr:ATP-grasp domain-containing protein [Actinoplanes regularis]GIE85783.1 hypothetical protein Are01nite_22630 [Actinoplanes regularis]SNR77811.1 hypothetical protein SAMN06264365_105399 [Actinoplanes regularis]
MILLLPADVLHPRRVDEHFAAEEQAARALGWSVALVDHDALAATGTLAGSVTRAPGGEVALYRGWMLSSRAYAGLATALATRDIRLYTDAERYRRAHELPGWYAALSDFTPASTWTTGTDRTDFDAARSALGSGPAVVRDYSKSMKHYWHEATYIPDLTDAAGAWAVAQRMLELRGDDLTGGFVLRRYEPFVGPEVRTWWVNGTCRLVTAHPDTPHEPLPQDLDLTPLRPAVATLNLSFVTIDLTRRSDGAWRIVELGDGQVSDRPTTTPPEDLISALTQP